MKKIFGLCKPYFITYKCLYTMYIFLCIIISIKSLVLPYITGNFIDFLIVKQNTDIIVNYCILFIIITLVGLIVGYISDRLYVKLQTIVSFELNKDILAHLQKVRYTFFVQKDISSLNQRINNDSNAVVTFCISLFQNMTVNIVTIILGFVIIYSFDEIIAIVLISFLPCYFLIYRAFKQILYKRGYVLKEHQAQYFSKLYEQLIHIKQIKLFNLFEEFSKRLQGAFNGVLIAALQYQQVSFQFSSLDTVILSIGQIFLFFYGGKQVLSGNLSIGNFATISTYFMMLMSSVRYFFSLGKNIQDTKVSYERLIELMNIPKESVGNMELSDIKSIRVRNLSLYMNHKIILNNVNTVLQKGAIYAITGLNGAGKSSLLNVISGLYINEFDGNVLINNMPIQKIDMYNLRYKHFGISEQNPVIFTDTIEYNMRLNRLKVNSTLEDHLMHLLGIDALIRTFSDGMDTIVNENYSMLSGGEKQKISLIRALITDSTVLLLDEPTSTLDSSSSINFMNYLKSIKKDKIIVVITHDLTVIKEADEVITLKNGQLER